METPWTSVGNQDGAHAEPLQDRVRCNHVDPQGRVDVAEIVTTEIDDLRLKCVSRFQADVSRGIGFQSGQLSQQAVREAVEARVLLDTRCVRWTVVVHRRDHRPDAAAEIEETCSLVQ